MASKSSSMDIVSEIDVSEVKSDVKKYMQEIQQRFGFKNSKSEITLEKTENTITIRTADENKLRSDINKLQDKVIKHNKKKVI